MKKYTINIPQHIKPITNVFLVCIFSVLQFRRRSPTLTRDVAFAVLWRITEKTVCTYGMYIRSSYLTCFCSYGFLPCTAVADTAFMSEISFSASCVLRTVMGVYLVAIVLVRKY